MYCIIASELCLGTSSIQCVLLFVFFSGSFLDNYVVLSKINCVNENIIAFLVCL